MTKQHGQSADFDPVGICVPASDQPVLLNGCADEIGKQRVGR
jgi:hypothetical protein